MADDVKQTAGAGQAKILDLVWLRDPNGLHAYHTVCAERFNITGNDAGEPYHTQICELCARYLDWPPETAAH